MKLEKLMSEITAAIANVRLMPTKGSNAHSERSNPRNQRSNTSNKQNLLTNRPGSNHHNRNHAQSDQRDSTVKSRMKGEMQKRVCKITKYIHSRKTTTQPTIEAIYSDVIFDKDFKFCNHLDQII